MLIEKAAKEQPAECARLLCSILLIIDQALRRNTARRGVLFQSPLLVSSAYADRSNVWSLTSDRWATVCFGECRCNGRILDNAVEIFLSFCSMADLHFVSIPRSTTAMRTRKDSFAHCASPGTRYRIPQRGNRARPGRAPALQSALPDLGHSAETDPLRYTDLPRNTSVKSIRRACLSH